MRLSITAIRGHRTLYFSVAQQPNLGRGPLIVEVCRPHRVKHTHTAGRTPQIVAEAATYTTHIKLEGRIYILAAGFEPAIPTTKRPQI